MTLSALRVPLFWLLRRGLVAMILTLPIVSALAQEPGPTEQSYGYKPSAGYVPNSKTAVKIAEAVLIPVYGEKTILSEEPFTAHLKGDVWTVDGTLRCPDGKGGLTTFCFGGVAIVKLSKTDGRILFMTHEK